MCFTGCTRGESEPPFTPLPLRRLFVRARSRRGLVCGKKRGGIKSVTRASELPKRGAGLRGGDTRGWGGHPGPGGSGHPSAPGQHRPAKLPVGAHRLARCLLRHPATPAAARPPRWEKRPLSPPRAPGTLTISPTDRVWTLTGRRWSPHPWRGSKTVWMWHFRTWFSRHGGVGVMVGLDDLRGLLQP